MRCLRNADGMLTVLAVLVSTQCAALFLLDHLKLVTSRSERNKMGSQALAECFGPVVMCHTETGSPVADLRRPIEVFAYLLDIWPLNRGELRLLPFLFAAYTTKGLFENTTWM